MLWMLVSAGPTQWHCSNRSAASVGPTPYRGVGLVLVVLRESSPLTLPIYFYAKIVILRHLKQEVLEIDTDLSSLSRK